MFGFLNINKPTGISSYDVIRHLKRLLPRGEKIGHAGTLDPFATGVLVVALGHACRLIEHVQTQPKEYRAAIILGATSDTDDAVGVITPTPAGAAPGGDDIRRVLASMIGTIQQVPPAHSAVHVRGRRAYEMAREGEKVELAARPVEIHAIELLAYDWPALEIHVTCGSGTYIRALARDIGRALGVGGYCRGLVRTRVGPFSLEQARGLEQVRPLDDLISPLAAVAGLPTVQADEAQLRSLSYGQAIPAGVLADVGPHAFPQTAGVKAWRPAGGLRDATTSVAIVDERGGLAAMGRLDAEAHMIRPTAVFIVRT